MPRSKSYLLKELKAHSKPNLSPAHKKHESTESPKQHKAEKAFLKSKLPKSLASKLK